MGLEILRYANFNFKFIHPVGLNYKLKIKQKPSNSTV